MRNKNIKNKLSSIYLMFGMILLVIGFSYAFFIYNKTSLYTHTITGGKMKVIYDETSGNNILIENAYPRTDAEALTYGLEFEFTVTGYNESEKNVYYAIEMDYGEDLNGKNRFLDTDMKLTLYENDKEVFENEIFNNLDNQDIHYSYFKAGTNSQTPTVNNYKLRLWINDNVVISDTLSDDLIDWSDFEWDWLYENYPDKYDYIYNTDEPYLSDYGISIYTSEEFANSYANFKINIKADLNYKDVDYLTYDANGGEYTPKKTSLLTGKITQQKSVMENKGFLGWSSNPNAIIPEYYSGDYYSGEGQVLYAVYSDTRNVMGAISDDIYNNIEDVTEVYFINDTIENINLRYDAANIKSDLTLDNQGRVLGWLETNSDDGTTYALYIGSEGTTYLSDCKGMFYDCYSITNIYFDNVDTSMVTDMSWMFGTGYNGMGFEELDVTSFNTSNVTNMAGMFGTEIDYGSLYIEELDLSNFDTSNVEDMSYMFSNCVMLVDLDISSFNTSKVTNMRSMFYYCESLYELELSHFDTSNVTDMSYMFRDCGITKLNIEGFDTSNVTTMSYMFFSNDNLISLDLSHFDTSNVTNMSFMFRASDFSNLNVSNWDTGQVTDMSYMFVDCDNLQTLDVSDFDTSNVTDMTWMFEDLDGIRYLDLSNFDTSKVISMSCMFRNSENLMIVDLTEFVMTNVTNTSAMFSGCNKLTTIYANSDWNTGNITSDNNMFYNCSKLSGAISYTYGKFSIAYANPDTGYFTYKYD